MHSFSIIFLIALFANIFIQIWLDRRQANQVQIHRNAVPEEFSSQINLEEHKKAADYTLAKLKLGGVSLFWSSLLLIGWTLGGGLNLLDQAWRGLELPAVATGVAVIMSLMLIGGALDLPFSIYRTFNLEEKFGFNRTTPRTFVIDLLKGLLLMLLIGLPLTWLVLWLMQGSGPLWWLYVWAVWFSFSLLMMWAFPRFIAPLFNKFMPLENENLKTTIQSLLERCGFKSSGVFVMDGSKRSGHGNAYFTGLGSNKRIVFFDTLLETLSDSEIEAVLAHELGHFKHGHIRKRIMVMAVLSLAGLALLGWLMLQDWFYAALGVTEPSVHAALVLFLLVSPVFTFFLSPVGSYFSRRHEFEADDFASANADAQAMIRALVKLYRENASTLTPDALYSAFHDSHPPAPIRVKHLAEKSN